MKLLIYLCCVLSICTAHAGEQRIYQTDSLGNVQPHKPSYLFQKGGRIIETDSIGNKQFHKQQYLIKDGEIYPIDSVGNIQQHKPRLLLKMSLR